MEQELLVARELVWQLLLGLLLAQLLIKQLNAITVLARRGPEPVVKSPVSNL